MNENIFSLSGKSILLASDVADFAIDVASGLAAFGAKPFLILPKCNVKARARADSANVEIFETDLSEDQSMVVAIQSVATLASGIDVLVTRFGIESERPLMSVTEKDLRSAFETVWIALRFAQLCKPFMIKRGGGLIINMLPISASWPAGGDGPSAMASAAGQALSQSLALAGAPDSIRSIALSVGGRDGQPGGVLKRNLIGRQVHIDEVVGTLVALSSKAGGFVTANNFVLDGGELAV